MWEAISNVFTGSSAGLAMASVFGMAVLVAVLAKMGIVSIHRKGVKIGSRPDALGERFILKKQIDFVRSYAAAKEGELRAIINANEEGQTDEYRNDPKFYIKWMLEMAVSYMVTNWIMLNSITADPSRNAVRTHELRLYISSLSGNGEYDKRVLGKQIDAWGAEILEGLCRIRRELSERR